MTTESLEDRLGGEQAAEMESANRGDRPFSWAQPIELAGVENLHEVRPGFYRSGQPTAEGMRNLEKMGIKTIVNLRAYHSDEDEIEGTNLKEIRIPMRAWRPKRKHLEEFMRAVSDPENRPLLVHCWHGADRTGLMCASARVILDGWSKEEAEREMVDGGFGFHEIWSNLITWLREAELEGMQEKRR